MALYSTVLDLIGNTPLVDISALSPNPAARIYMKLEGQNPGGSVKDRVALSLVEEAERAGVLVPGKPDQVLMEPTSGNTGIGLAMVCRVKGYTLKVVMPTNVSVERRQLLELWGAEIIESPGSEGSNGAVRMARGLAEEHPEWVFLYQYGNPANPKAHYEGTGPEILRDCPGITHFVAGLGTSGTLLGVGRFLREKLGDAVQIWAVEPPAGEMVDGLRNLDDGYIPPIFEDLGGAELLDRKTVVRPRESIEWTRRLTEVGVFAGISTGAALAGAVKCAVVVARGRGGVHRRGLGRRRLEVPLDRGLDGRPRRGHRAGQVDHLLLGGAPFCRLARVLRRWAEAAPRKSSLCRSTVRRRDSYSRSHGPSSTRSALMAASHAAPALAVVTTGLTKEFGKRRVVDGLDLAIPSGSVCGFVGPNGAGKTTTIRMLLGLIRPTGGTGRILHGDLQHPASYLARVGALIESPAFYPALSGRDNLLALVRLGQLAPSAIRQRARAGGSGRSCRRPLQPLFARHEATPGHCCRAASRPVAPASSTNRPTAWIRPGSSRCGV